ncbi:MAG: class I adenylate-forming enzyme family protein [Acidimicrobiia bacterium]
MWLASAARRRPNRPFVVTPEGPCSFAEVDERVRRAIGALRAGGPGPGRRVAVWTGNDLDTVVALLAVPGAGAESVVLNSRLTVAEAGEQVVRSNAGAVVGPATTPDLGVPRIDPSELRGSADQGVAPDPQATHSIFFTSGSSGAPKGVRLTWTNLEASAAASAAHLGHAPGDVWLAVLPLHHLGGFSILVRSARQATTVLLEPSFDPDRVGALLEQGGATLASLVATMLGRMLDARPGPYRGVRAVLVGGGPVSPVLLHRAVLAGLPALPTYGLTETASQVATARLESGPASSRRVLPLPGVELRIDRLGMILVRGPMVSPGYLDEPDRPPGAWLETGDLGELDGEGGLRVLGRADQVVITGGENVHLAEVEQALAACRGVRAVTVVGVPDARWGEILAAVYVGEVTPAELERHARDRLAGYKVPKRWAQVETLPGSALGKVDRLRVKAIAEGRT